jgi:hypothetical protein
MTTATRTGADLLFSRLSWALACCAAAAYLGILAYLARGAWHLLPHATGFAFVIGVAGGLRRQRAVLFAILLTTCLVPALAVLSSLNYYYWSLQAIWLAALLGWIVASGRRDWSAEVRLRIPLALWAMCVALSAGVVMLREADFSTAGFLERTATSAGVAVPLVVQWIALVSAATLVGILWFDRLFDWPSSNEPRAFPRDVVVPLALGWGIALSVGLYQALVDPAYLNMGFWVFLRRASGTLMDANAFGMLCALWAPSLGSALAGRPHALAPLGAIVTLAIGWAGVWASGSRGAFVVAAIGTGAVLLLLASRAERRRLRVPLAAVVLVSGLVLFLVRHTGPLERLAPLFSAFASSPARALQILWERDGYGLASLEMIRQHPVSGVGVGILHHTIGLYSPPALGYKLPPDNAQNWYRHQIAELGPIGSLGPLLWTLSFAWLLLRALARRSSPHETRGIAAVLVGFGLISLVAMPGQSLPVAITFWTLAFWCASRAGLPEPDARRGHSHAWIFLVAIASAHLVATIVAARHELRPPFRAARFDMEYSHGVAFGPEGAAWTTDERAVAVPKAGTDTLRITYWVEHPDAAQRPVQVNIRRDREPIANRRMWRNMRYTEYVPVTAGKRFVLEAQVDRLHVATADEGAAPERRGLTMRWEYVNPLIGHGGDAR